MAVPRTASLPAEPDQIKRLVREINNFARQVGAAASELDLRAKAAGQPLVSPAAMRYNARLYLDARNRAYGQLVEKPLSRLFAATASVVEAAAPTLQPPLMLWVTQVEAWGGRGLDLLRPLHLDESEVWRPDRAVVVAWSADRETLIRGLVRLERLATGNTPLLDGVLPPNLLRWRGLVIQLAPIDWRLLKSVWDGPPVELERVAEEVWGQGDVPDARIKSAVSKLNKRLAAERVALRLRVKAGHLLLVDNSPVAK